MRTSKDQQIFNLNYLSYTNHMPSDICKPLVNQVMVPESTRLEAKRIAAFVMTGFIMVLKIAGYRFRLLSDKGEAEQRDNPSGYSGIYSGTKRSQGSDVENLLADAWKSFACNFIVFVAGQQPDLTMCILATNRL